MPPLVFESLLCFGWVWKADGFRVLAHLDAQGIVSVILYSGHLLFPLDVHFYPAWSSAIAKLLHVFVYHLRVTLVALQQNVDDISRKRNNANGEEAKDLDPHESKHPKTQFLVVGLLLLVSPWDDAHDDDYDDGGEDGVEKVADTTSVRYDRR